MYLSNEQIKTIQIFFQDTPVEKLYLFGSYARGDANENSDIDLAFGLQKGTRISYFGLAKYLVDLEKNLDKKIDLVEEDLIYPRIKNSFDKEKKKIL